MPRRLFHEKEKNTIIGKVANCCRGREPHLDFFFFFSFPGLFCSMRIGKLKEPERMNASGENTRLSCTSSGFVGRSEILLTWASFSAGIKAGFGPLLGPPSPTVGLNGLSLGGGGVEVGVTAQGRGDIKVSGELGGKYLPRRAEIQHFPTMLRCVVIAPRIDSSRLHSRAAAAPDWPPSTRPPERQPRVSPRSLWSGLERLIGSLNLSMLS